MASGLLVKSSQPIVHAIPHDLESFYWTLLWVVLRHTDNRLANVKGQSRHETCADTFKQDNAALASMAKSHWLLFNAEHLQIYRNRPLTVLLSKFKELVASKRLDYDNVLALFDEALATESWPDAKNDGFLDYIPPDLRTVNEFSSFEARESDLLRRHARKRARARKGKGRETTAEQDDDDDDDGNDNDDDYDDPWELNDQDVLRPDADNVAWNEGADDDYLSAPDEEDWQDAADVSAMLGYDVDMEDSNADTCTEALLQHMGGLTFSAAQATAEAGSSGVAESQTESHSGQLPVRRRVAAATTSGSESRQRPQTRAQTIQAAAAIASELVGRGAMARSGPQTRSITRAGTSGGTRSEGGSQTGSRVGSRRAQ